MPSSPGQIAAMCPSLTRSASFEPSLTELERTKNQWNSGGYDAQLRFKPALPADQHRLMAADLPSTRPDVSTDTKTTESTAACVPS